MPRERNVNGEPFVDEIDITLDVLLWLHENTDDGRLRDEISHVRNELDERFDP